MIFLVVIGFCNSRGFYSHRGRWDFFAQQQQQTATSINNNDIPAKLRLTNR